MTSPRTTETMGNERGTVLGSAWTLDHVGHAVHRLEPSLERYCSLYGFQIELRETIEDQRVEAAFLTLANSSIELIAPLPGNTTLSRFLERRGEGLHHICFLVPSVAAALVELQQKGAELIDHTPRPGSRGMEIAFIHPRSNGGALIELCSKPLSPEPSR